MIVITLPLLTLGQDLKTNLFVRSPQVINYNFNQKNIGLNTVLSVGAGLSYRSKFVELATFIDDTDTYGFYTFFGKTLKTKDLTEDWYLYTNWFGEFTYLPNQNDSPDIWISTTGICLFLNHNFDWGAIGLPLCMGVAYLDREFSLNTRAIINVSILLN